MQAGQSILVWDLPTRVLHWLLALAAAAGTSGWLALGGYSGKMMEEVHEGVVNAMRVLVLLIVAVAAFWGAALRGELPALTQPALERQESDRDDD